MIKITLSEIILIYINSWGDFRSSITLLLARTRLLKHCVTNGQLQYCVILCFALPPTLIPGWEIGRAGEWVQLNNHTVTFS